MCTCIQIKKKIRNCAKNFSFKQNLTMYKLMHTNKYSNIQKYILVHALAILLDKMNAHKHNIYEAGIKLHHAHKPTFTYHIVCICTIIQVYVFSYKYLCKQKFMHICNNTLNKDMLMYAKKKKI